MKHPLTSLNDRYFGMIMAFIAVVIWSGNFVIARGISHIISPFELAFFRWSTASCLIFPFAFKQIKQDIPSIIKHWKYLFWVSLTGITLFNTLVYIAGHYTTAINLALIGTTSSPIFASILAVIFLKEKII